MHHVSGFTLYTYDMHGDPVILPLLILLIDLRVDFLLSTFKTVQQMFSGKALIKMLLIIWMNMIHIIIDQIIVAAGDRDLIV